MAALIAASVVVVLLLLATLAMFLIWVTKLLNTIADRLGTVAFGVRAVETQVARVEPGTLRLNDELDHSVATLERALGGARRSDRSGP